MKWMRFRIRTNPASEDRMIAAMMEIGLTGAQIEDKVPLTAAEKEQIYTFDVEDPVDDGIAYVSFFAEADEGNRLKVTLPDGREVTRSPEKLQEEIQAVLSTLREGGDIGDGTLSLSLTEDIDWMNNWKQYFHHFYLDGDILVIPSWEKLRKEDTAGAKYILYMDPGTAFGTGAHDPEVSEKGRSSSGRRHRERRAGNSGTDVWRLSSDRYGSGSVLRRGGQTESCKQRLSHAGPSGLQKQQRKKEVSSGRTGKRGRILSSCPRECNWRLCRTGSRGNEVL